MRLKSRGADCSCAWPAWFPSTRSGERTSREPAATPAASAMAHIAHNPPALCPTRRQARARRGFRLSIRLKLKYMEHKGCAYEIERRQQHRNTRQVREKQINGCDTKQ